VPQNPQHDPGEFSARHRHLADSVDFSRGAGGLLPAIAQDARTGRVLMLAWMNESALRETLETGQAVYFSRSRGKLWRKGETSGHRQRVREVRVDCDRDTLLLQVEQVGAACHEGYESCFFRSIDQEDWNLQVTDSRLVDPEQVYGSSDQPGKS
jgi:phosphoribosyl-AMP cyclohydrolase